jgi:hypothetical protein
VAREEKMTAFLDLLDGVLDAAMMLLALAILVGANRSGRAVRHRRHAEQPSHSQELPGHRPTSLRVRAPRCLFRQYFFAMDREELPFNRAQRAWVARAAKKLDSTIAFGSTKPLNRPGDIFFLNSPSLPRKTRLKRMRQPRWFLVRALCANPTQPPPFLTSLRCPTVRCQGPAIEALSMGAAKSSVWLNTGEGGLSPHHQTAACDLVFQIGTAKYGVRDEAGNLDPEKIKALTAIPQVKMFEIKLSQGAKPGKGGILPAEKVTDLIATTRGIPAGEDSISPNRHPEITDADSLLDLIDRVRSASGKPTGIKLVLGQTAWLDDFCEAIHARGLASAPDFITVDSADGGTGAAPQGLMDNMGLPVSSSLPLVHSRLTAAGLRERVKLVASGKMINPAGVAAALCLGADVVCSARGFMLSLGCIQALQCNENTCPTGITTQDPKLQKGLDPIIKADRVANYAISMREEVDLIAHSCGVLDPQALSRQHAFVVNAEGVPELLAK